MSHTQAPRDVVHVTPCKSEPYLSGRDLERYERVARRWHERGAILEEVPDDGQEHRMDRPCPACGRRDQS